MDEINRQGIEWQVYRHPDYPSQEGDLRTANEGNMDPPGKKHKPRPPAHPHAPHTPHKAATQKRERNLCRRGELRRASSEAWDGNTSKGIFWVGFLATQSRYSFGILFSFLENSDSWKKSLSNKKTNARRKNSLVAKMLLNSSIFTTKIKLEPGCLLIHVFSVMN